MKKVFRLFISSTFEDFRVERAVLQRFVFPKIKEKAHKLLIQDILKEAGIYRTKNVGVGNEKEITHIAPPVSNMPKLMNDLF